MGPIPQKTQRERLTKPSQVNKMVAADFQSAISRKSLQSRSQSFRKPLFRRSRILNGSSRQGGKAPRSRSAGSMTKSSVIPLLKRHRYARMIPRARDQIRFFITQNQIPPYLCELRDLKIIGSIFRRWIEASGLDCPTQNPSPPTPSPI